MAMKILVCVRSVPVAGCRLAVNAAGTGFAESGLSFQVNEYDRYAMEEAVRLKEGFGAEVAAVTVGPERAETQLRQAMGLGADRGARIESGDDDALTTASLIAAWARDQAFDLILAGVMSEDLQRSQVGPMVAALLRAPCATTVIALTLDPGQGRVRCVRELEGGRREEVELTLPAVVTVQSGINTPRYGALSQVLRVKRLAIPVIPAETLGSAPRGERVRRVELARPAGKCEFLAGTPAEMALELARRLEARGLTQR
jgi:electron transfer flavoprotein beta subunit